MVHENPSLTPGEVMNILELGEEHREHIENHCAIMRLIRFGASHGDAFNDQELAWENVEWSDVKDWLVAKSLDW